MPYVTVNVDIDTDEVLDELRDEELEAELARRRQKKGEKAGHPAHYSIPQKAARYTLEEAADILRRTGRNDLAFKLEEIRTDFVGH